MSNIYRAGRNPAKALYRHWRAVMSDPSGRKDTCNLVPYGRGILDARGDWIDLDFRGITMLSIRPNGDFRIGWMASSMTGEDRRQRLRNSSFLDLFHNGRGGYSWAVGLHFRPDSNAQSVPWWGACEDHALRLPHVPEWVINARSDYSSRHPWLRLFPDETWGWRIELARRQSRDVDGIREHWQFMVEQRERRWERSLRDWEIRTGVRTVKPRNPPTTVPDETVALFAAAFDLSETYVHTPLREAREAQHGRNHAVVQPLHHDQ